jgi:large subunit ribosomal protein L2
MELLKKLSHTNGVRHKVNIKKNLLSKNVRLLKVLMSGVKQFQGRSSNTGSITVRNRGGGVKRLFRYINFSDKTFLALTLLTMYDSFRNSFVNLNFNFVSKTFFYSLATDNLSIGSLTSSNRKMVEFDLGNRLLVLNIPSGSVVHSLYHFSFQSIQYIRAAGVFGQLLEKTYTLARIRLPSGYYLIIPSHSSAILGRLSNSLFFFTVHGKAGRKRLLGCRPSVRGVAMNPVDHPHGGRTNGGKHPVTPWGFPTRGKPTVTKKKINIKSIL